MITILCDTIIDKTMFKTELVTLSPKALPCSDANFFKDFKFLNMVPKATNVKNDFS